MSSDLAEQLQLCVLQVHPVPHQLTSVSSSKKVDYREHAQSSLSSCITQQIIFLLPFTASPSSSVLCCLCGKGREREGEREEDTERGGRRGKKKEREREKGGD